MSKGNKNGNKNGNNRRKKYKIPKLNPQNDRIMGRTYQLIVNQIFKPEFDNSTLIITLKGWFEIKGNVGDELDLRISVRDLTTQKTEIIQNVKINHKKKFFGQGFNNIIPQVLFPIKGKYINTTSNNKQIRVKAKRNSEMKIIRKNELVLTIEEIQ
jgi:hypothetical protein